MADKCVSGLFAVAFIGWTLAGLVWMTDSAEVFWDVYGDTEFTQLQADGYLPSGTISGTPQ